MSPGDDQDLWEDQACDDISREPAAPEPLLPHPANQHQDRAAEVSDPEESGSLQVPSITNQEAGQPKSPRQQVGHISESDLHSGSDCCWMGGGETCSCSLLSAVTVSSARLLQEFIV